MIRTRVNIALVIKTTGLEYDDRVRKEINTICKLCPDASFKIFAMLEKNERINGFTSYGIPYESIFIPARDKYPSASHLSLKAWQFYKTVNKLVKGFDVVWVANVDASLIAMLVRAKKLVWDLHELPEMFLGNPLRKAMLRYIFNRCDLILHANEERLRYLESVGAVKEPEKHIAVRNFPNFADEDPELDEKYHGFVKWKGTRKCIYLQGLAGDKRAAFETVEAVMRTPDFCAVVVGGFDPEAKSRLKAMYGGMLDERINFIGRIPQLKIPQYVKQCFTTLVFYKNVSPNNYYCEANRFYQSVVEGLPVVVGNNPTMKSLVDKYKIGVAIESDGRDIEMIVEGINNIVTNYDTYVQNIIKYKDNFLWDTQDEVFKKIILKLNI